MRNRRRSAMIFGLLLVASTSACTTGGSSSPQRNSLPPIALIRGTNDVYLLSSSGAWRYVTTGQGVSWTPDHKELLVQRVAYITPPSSEIWLVSTSGKSIRQVTFVYPDQVRFFAAGTYRSVPFLAYDTDKNGIQLRNLATGAERTIPVGATVDSLAISPDGKQIAFVADSAQDSIPITLYIAGTYQNSPRRQSCPPASTVSSAIHRGRRTASG